MSVQRQFCGRVPHTLVLTEITVVSLLFYYCAGFLAVSESKEFVVLQNLDSHYEGCWQMYILNLCILWLRSREAIAEKLGGRGQGIVDAPFDASALRVRAFLFLLRFRIGILIVPRMYMYWDLFQHVLGPMRKSFLCVLPACMITLLRN